MSDVINLARKGVPSVGLITERFAEQAAFTATSLGMPGAPWLELPYPIAGTGSDAMAAIAQAVAPSIVESLREYR